MMSNETIKSFGEQFEAAAIHTVTFTLPFVPPSVNSLYSVSFKGKGHPPDINLKDECRQWKNRAADYIPRFKIAEDSVLRIDWCVYYKWLTKTGTWAKRDTDNMGKLLHDTISKRLNVDDRRFKCGMMDSVNSPAERTIVVLTEIPISEWSARV